MADATLKTDYKDDVLDTSINTQRKYQMIQNEDGTVSFVDVTEYSQVGDSFGGADINATNEAVNELYSDKLGNVVMARRELVVGENLNNITTPGIYTANTEIAETLVNSLWKNAFTMVVYRNNNQIVQEQTRTGVAGYKATRSCFGTSWKDWAIFAMSDVWKDIESNAKEISKIKNILGTSYMLVQNTIIPGDGWSVSNTRADLRGNTLLYRFEASREEATAVGDIKNEIIATVTLEHDGKIKEMPVSSGVTTRVGGVGTLYVTEISVTSTTVTFTILLCATATALQDIAAYIDIPVTLNVDAY